jgi:hypothetical protein
MSELKINCFSITSFQLNVKNCPRQFTILFLPIMTIAMTALQKRTSRVFLNFTIEIYNRWGALIWQGDNNRIGMLRQQRNAFR